jgi:hypothetical protein
MTTPYVCPKSGADNFYHVGGIVDHPEFKLSLHNRDKT